MRLVLQELDAACGALAGVRGVPAGTLRIHAYKSAVQGLLRGVIPSFLTRYPEVQLDLVTDGCLVDIVAEGFDAGIRLAEDVPQDMIAVRFGGDVRFLAVAAPGYLAVHPTPRTPDDLRRHHCIRRRVPSGRLCRWEFSKRGQEVAVDVPGALTLDDNELMILAASDGLGIAYVLEFFARAQLEAGMLVPVLADWCPPLPGLTLFYPGRRHVPSTLRAFIDVLKEDASYQPPQSVDQTFAGNHHRR